MEVGWTADTANKVGRDFVQHTHLALSPYGLITKRTTRYDASMFAYYVCTYMPGITDKALNMKWSNVLHVCTVCTGRGANKPLARLRDSVGGAER
mmetsp:Transcript_19265/g.48531  ORF Transcript_19265/g.48531 Transcript_19265/m.48531 type:complete len:95 (-) Transcript_19265:347-631(-)